MKKIRIVLATLAVALMASLAFAQAPAVPKKSKIPAKLKSEAKITPEEARAIAAKKVPGTLLEEELEVENGKLVYSYDIQVAGDKQITEVQVDAKDGSIVSVEKEDAQHEAAEKKAEKKKSAPQN